MKKLFILLAIVAVASGTPRIPKELGEKIFAHLFDLSALQSDESLDVADNEVKFESNREDFPPIDDPAKLGWILNNEGKKKVQSVLDTMPCGWPDSGIPPLAPYRREEMLIDIKKSVIETLTKLIRFRVDGLDAMVINKLKISYTFSQKVKFNFTFPQIRISGRYATDTFINLLEEYGISIRLEGDGSFELILENLNLDGSFKYKMPLIFGSARIYKWQSVMTLGNCIASLNGLLGNGRANNLINDEIESTVMWGINGNQEAISAKIEELVVPNVNAQLKGTNIWDFIFGSSTTSDCVPPPDPWA